MYPRDNKAINPSETKPLYPRENKAINPSENKPMNPSETKLMYHRDTILEEMYN